MTDYDAILVPGGGVREKGELPSWSQLRLDRAIEMHNTDYIIALSAGTVHKSPPLAENGFPILESYAAARYLIKQGIPPDHILAEASSYDTIGNAYFSRAIHVEPAGFKKLLIITSQFHMPRTKAIFQWLYTLDSQPDHYELTFEAVPNVGISPADLQARVAREANSLKQFLEIAPTLRTLHDCHHWLFTQHTAYALSSQAFQVTDKSLNTY